jgi:LacI family transcriptional regulator
MARVTLATIAARTGLSKFAVSRALSGKEGVSAQTRQRVQDAAAELGYVRPVPETEERIIGLIFPDQDLINSELHLLIQGGVQAEALARRFQVRMRWTHRADEVEDFMRTCSAAVLVGLHDPDSLAKAYASGKPIVRTGWLSPLEPVDHVGGTDHEAGSAVARHLYELGHRQIAYVHGAPGYRGRIERFYGVREVLELLPDVTWREMKFDAEVRFTEHFLAARKEGFDPTAFFCAHDGLALTVVSELLRLGYRIPEDYSVIGFGDFSAATQISPQLTTVRTRGREMGAACVRLLDDRLNGRIAPDVSLRLLLAGHIVERDSCGPPRPLDAPLRAASL